MNIDNIFATSASGSPANELTSALDTRQNLLRIDYLQAVISKYKKDLLKCPEGHLKAVPHGTGFEYYQRRTSADKWEYIHSKNRTIVRRLGQKVYLKRLLASAEKELQARLALASVLDKGTIESLFMSMPKSYHGLIHPIAETSQEFYERWMAEEYEPGFFRPDEKFY